ncbi:MAG: hypothetical protein WCK78_12230 [Paludibacter sp.]
MQNLKQNKLKKPNPLFTELSITNRTKDVLTIETNNGLSREIHPSVLTDKGLDVMLDEVHVPITWMEDWFAKSLGETKQVEDDKNKSLFYNHIALFIAHKELILSDSRYYMAPVSGVNFGLYYVGNFNNMPIGAWLEIWSLYPDTIDNCPCGAKAPIVSFGGSPLSGAHSRTAICLQCGKTIENTTGKFHPIWKPFAEVQKKYNQLSKRNVLTLENLIKLLESKKDLPNSQKE